MTTTGFFDPVADNFGVLRWPRLNFLSVPEDVGIPRAMIQPYRLASGGRIDRSRVLPFQFGDGEYEGHPGDTLASALLANGVRLVGRSFKYHRPRGILTAVYRQINNNLI